MPCENATVGFSIPRYANEKDFDIAITHRWDFTACVPLVTALLFSSFPEPPTPLLIAALGSNGNTAYWERKAQHTVSGDGVTCFATPAHGLSFCDYPAVVIAAERVGQTVEFVPV